MKKSFLILATVFSTMLFSSCGGNSGSENAGSDEQSAAPTGIKPETTKVSGDLGDYFTVVDRNYKATGDYFKCVTVEFERTEAPLPFDPSKVMLSTYGYAASEDYVRVGFGIEFLDADGNIIEKITPGYEYSNDDPKELMKLKPGERGSVRFSIDNDQDVVKFRIISSCDVDQYKPSSSSSRASNMGDVLQESVDAYGQVLKKTADAYSDAIIETADAYSEALNKFSF